MASEDLKAERAASKLDLPQLTKILDGGEDVTRRRRRMGKSPVCHFNAMTPVQLQSLRSFFLHRDGNCEEWKRKYVCGALRSEAVQPEPRWVAIACIC